MWLLHSGNDRGIGRTVRTATRFERGRCAQAHEWTSLPLLRVPEHREGNPARHSPSEEVNMPDDPLNNTPLPEDIDQIIEPVEFDFGLKRRTFVQLVATGLAILTSPMPSLAQQRGGQRGGGAQVRNLWERVHIGTDGMVTLFCGKVEVGQGSRAEFTQAAAEE